MAINSKNISKNDLQLYIEDDILDDKKKYISEIESKFNSGSKLQDDETKIINQLNILRKVDNLFEEAIKNQPSIPKSLQTEINETINLISNKKSFFLQEFLNLKYFISAGVGAIAAITAMTFITVSSTNLAFRSVNTSNIPSSWIIKNDVAFALSHVYTQQDLDTTKKVKVNLNDILSFTLIPSKSKTIDIKYLSNDGKETLLYNNLSIKKGIKFVSRELKIALPIGIDKIQILENDEIILEKEIIVVH